MMKQRLIFFTMLLLSFTCLFILVTDYQHETDIIKPNKTGILYYHFYNHTTKEVTKINSGIPIYQTTIKK